MNPPTKTPAPAPPDPTPGPATRRKSRVCTRKACESCREKKAKCNGASPCSRCASRGLECRYETRSYQTKRSLKAELEDLRDGQRRLDAVIAALATPDQSDRVLRKLWEGNSVAEIYETISGETSTSAPSPPPPPPPTVKEEVVEPEPATGTARWASADASVSRPSMSTSPGSVAFAQPARIQAQESFEIPPAATGTYYTQAGNVPLGGVPFGAYLDNLTTTAAASQFSQPGYAISPITTDAFALSPFESFDASMMTGLNLAAAGAEFQQQYPADNMGVAAGCWACDGAATPAALPSFPSKSSTESLSCRSWQFPIPTGAEAPGSLSVSSVTPSTSPTAPHPPPPRDPVRDSVASSSVSDALDNHSPSKRRKSDLYVAVVSTDEDDNDYHHPDYLPRRSRSRPPPSPRERNRRASARSWQRQKRQLSELQDAKAEAEVRNKELRRQHSRALAEVLAVKDALMGHAGCDHPDISGWLQNQANKFVMSGSGGRPGGEVGARGGGGSESASSSAPARGGRQGTACRPEPNREPCLAITAVSSDVPDVRGVFPPLKTAEPQASKQANVNLSPRGWALDRHRGARHGHPCRFRASHGCVYSSVDLADLNVVPTYTPLFPQNEPIVARLVWDRARRAVEGGVVHLWTLDVAARRPGRPAPRGDFSIVRRPEPLGRRLNSGFAGFEF
ncbi:fungal specific transcription factor domain-containing protein [Colletotrichum plurivorum]|uniref:Fungal specific transcription factor domain-containing protein n=1 Tax=Colletotrichum plurivorum TaxID=2175906 RepID=A0A8H6KFZ5_9PEZI|nr:fungal specific transcription factor domain-containing protein [Colletotrichum plurivorum]